MEDPNHKNKKNREEDDQPIVDALSSLGWVEEKEETPVENLSEEEGLLEQLTLFRQRNEELNQEIAELKQERGDLLRKNEQLSTQNQQIAERLEGPEQDSQINETHMDGMEELTLTVQEKENIIESLEDRITKKEKIIQDQTGKIKSLQNEISNLKEKVDELQSGKAETSDLSKKLKEKNEKIDDLNEQIQYLQEDTIPKSKYDKLEVLIEKKDELLTQKEKDIFELKNTISDYQKEINELEQQLETFSLVKKDLEKKEERIESLVLENEKLKQKNLTNLEIISRLEDNLEKTQQKSGELTGKFELEYSNMQYRLKEKDKRIKELTEEKQDLHNQLLEAEQIEDKILSDLQNLKDEKLKLESELEKKDQDIVELKKRIKLLRRDKIKSKLD